MKTFIEGAKFIGTRAWQGDSGAVTTQKYLFTGNSVNNDHNLTSNSCFKQFYLTSSKLSEHSTLTFRETKLSPPRSLPVRPWFQVITRPPLEITSRNCIDTM